MSSAASIRKAERAKEEQRQRRLRGHHIKKGLDELGDLDAPAPRPTKQARVVVASGAADTDSISATVIPTQAKTDGLKSDPSPSPSVVARTVFGPDWEEWKDVKRVLFSADASPQAKRTALSTLQLWQARVRRERPMPPYVEATAVLMDAMLCDEAADTPELRLVHLYGAALARVVHLMTGSFAVGRADTYRKRARQIQFPEEAVEVRQRVAHGALPALSELRWVSGLTLQFLFQHYWVLQEQHLRDLAKEAQTAQPKASRGGVSGRAAPAAPAKAPPISVDEIYDLLKELSDDSDDDSGDDEASSSTAAHPTSQSQHPTCLAGWTIG